MSDELPEGWASARLGDLLEPDGLFDGPFGSNLKTADYTDAGVRVVRLENLANLRFVEDKRTYISVQKYESLRRHTVVADDILFGSFVDGLPRVCLLPTLETPAIAKADCFCIRPRRDLVDRSYLVYLLSRQAVRDELIEKIHGATRPRITTKQLRDLEVALAPLAEQRRVVKQVEALLAEVNTARARLAKVSPILERFRQSVLAAACSGQLTGRGPDGWPIQPLEKTSIRIQIGPFGSLLHRGDYTANGIPLINPMHIADGRITPSAEMSVSPRKVDELAIYRLRKGDVILGRRGEMGRAAVVGATEDGFLCGTGSLFLRPSADKWDARFLCLVLRSPTSVAALEAAAVGSTMVNLNRTIVGNLEVPVVDLAAQKEIVRRVDGLFALADAVDAQVTAATARTEKITQSILARAFRGDLVPTEAEMARDDGREYESAAAMLESIRPSMSAAAAKTAGSRRRARAA